MTPAKNQTQRSAADQTLQYLEASLLTASPLELTRILYDLLLEALRRAADAADSGRIEERVRAVNRATAVLGELRCSLDLARGGEIAASLERLYAYCMTTVAGEASGPGGEHLRAVGRILEPLRDAFVQAIATEARAATAQTAAAAAPTAPVPRLEPVSA